MSCGVATQDKELRSRLKIDIGAKRLTNYLTSLEEIKTSLQEETQMIFMI